MPADSGKILQNTIKLEMNNMGCEATSYCNKFWNEYNGHEVLNDSKAITVATTNISYEPTSHF